MSKKHGIERAISFTGSVAQLAALVGTSQANIRNWRSVGRVPAEHCPKMERLTGVRCEALNPGVEWSVVRSKP